LEIIEFPICLLEAETNSIIDIYHSYVRPTIKSTLNEICINITGITQDIVDNSATLQLKQSGFDQLKFINNFINLKDLYINIIHQLEYEE